MFGAEIEVLTYLQNIRTNWLNSFFEAITMLGEEIPIVLIIVVLYFAIDKYIAQKFFLITALSLSFNGIIKNIVKLPRPFTTGKVICVRPETATGYSFPSAHTQNVATLGIISNLKFKKVGIWVTTILLVILVAFSRVFLGAHYVSDVIVGAILGTILGFLGYELYDKFINKKKLYAIILLILSPFYLYFLINPEIFFEDFFKFFGMILGLFLGGMFEEKFAPLEYNINYMKKIFRIVIGIFVAAIIKIGIEYIYIFTNVRLLLVLNSIGYFIMVFAVLGFCPILFKKCNL